MAIAVQRGGLATVKIDAGAGIETLGYTRNGADISKRPYMLDVPGDENGGDDGDPVEIQILGIVATVRLDLTKWDESVADKIRAIASTATAGTPPTAGTLLFANADTFRVLIDCATDNTHDRNFPVCVPREPIEQSPIGTKFSILTIEFTAYDFSGGTLYNKTMV